MPNYYSKTSFMVPLANKEEANWLQWALAENDEEEQYLGTEALLETSEDGSLAMWIHSEEDVEIETLAGVLRGFLEKFRPDDCLSFEVSFDCSKPLVDAYGGCAVFVTAKKVDMWSTGGWLLEKMNRFMNKAEKKRAIKNEQ